MRAVKYTFNILVNSKMQCSHVIQTRAQKCDGMHINVDAVYQRASKFARETIKLHLSAQSSLTSETRHFDALTHILTPNLYYCAYSGLPNTLKIHYINLCIWFGSCEDRRLNQSRSKAIIPG